MNIKTTNDMHTIWFIQKLLQSRYNIIDIKKRLTITAYNTMVYQSTVRAMYHRHKTMKRHACYYYGFIRELFTVIAIIS
jgi:hypothetical protein